MGGKLHRQSLRDNARTLYVKSIPNKICSNCKQETRQGHFVPPCFGEEGFYYCDPSDSYPRCNSNLKVA